MEEEIQDIINAAENESQILSAIEKRVVYMLEVSPDLLMSYLYRLDVLEKDLKLVLNGPTNFISTAISNLIWKRQKARLESRVKYKQDPIPGWEF